MPHPHEPDDESAPPPPVPKLQTLAVCSAVFANTFSELLIFSFLPFMIKHFYPEMSKNEVGYRAGFVGSSYYVGQFLSQVFWGRIADAYGRRLTMEIGVIGSFCCILAFGLSPTFYFACVVRLVWGLVNGNIGLSKTVLAELCTDNRQRQRAFSTLGMLGGLGRTLGPAVGGFLAKPSTYEDTFLDGALFRKFPFLLPCMSAALVCLICLFLVFMFLPETLHIATIEPDDSDREEVELAPLTYDRDSATFDMDDSDEEDDDDDLEQNENDERALLQHTPTSLEESRKSTFSHVRELLRDDEIFVAVMLYGLIGFIALANNELYPLWLVADPDAGGFGWESDDIGMVLLMVGPTQILFQLLVYPRLVQKLGCRNLLVTFVTMYACTLFLLPLAHVFTRPLGRTGTLAVVVAFLVVQVNVRVTSFVALFVCISHSAVTADRATVNSIAQSLASFGRLLAPAIASAMFAWSLNNGQSWPLDYVFTWYMLGFGCLLLARFSARLPDAIVVIRDKRA